MLVRSWFGTGSGLAQGWFRVGSRLVPCRFPAGSQQAHYCFASVFSWFFVASRWLHGRSGAGSKRVRGWLKVCSGFFQDWLRASTGMVQGWSPVGSRLVRGCFPVAFSLAHSNLAAVSQAIFDVIIFLSCLASRTVGCWFATGQTDRREAKATQQRITSKIGCETAAKLL